MNDATEALIKYRSLVGILCLIVVLWLLVSNVPELWSLFTCAASRGAC